LKPTLIILTVILLQQGLIAGLWAVMAALRLARGPAAHWAAAGAAVCAGLMLIGLRDSLPVWAGFWLSNACILAGVMSMRRGVALFAHRPLADREQLLFAVLALSALALALRDGMSWVVVTISSLALAYVVLRAAWTVHRHLAVEFGQRVATGCAVPLAVIGAVFALRAGIALVFPQAIGHSVHADNAPNVGTTMAFLVGGLMMHLALLALVFSRLALRLRHQSEHDELTGLLNRRAIQQRLAGEAERLQRYGHGYSLLSIDIDHFKRINDRHGHPAGDAVLRELATVLRRTGRGVDHVARAGGEEFWMLMPNTGREGALLFAERLRRAVAELRVPTPQGAIALTASIGVGVVVPPGESHDTLMQRVDAALYAAKQGGRDRVELAAASPPGEDGGAVAATTQRAVARPLVTS
jgi:diguanylate cyclase (GGDEF)-like protein